MAYCIRRWPRRISTLANITAGCSLELSFKTTLHVVAVLHLKTTRRTCRYDAGLKEMPLESLR